MSINKTFLLLVLSSCISFNSLAINNEQQALAQTILDAINEDRQQSQELINRYAKPEQREKRTKRSAQSKPYELLWDDEVIAVNASSPKSEYLIA